MLKDGMSLCNSCGRSTSGVECTNPGCQDALASARLAAVTAERDAYLETICATFRVLESRGQAPDDNAPLQVTVRRVLDFLNKVTAERDGWRQVHQTALDHAEERERHHAETVARLTAERDALAAQLAALQKRLADAVKSHAVSPWGGLSKGYAVGARTVDKPGRYALVRLEDEE